MRKKTTFFGSVAALAGGFLASAPAFAEGAGETWFSGARHPASQMMHDILWFEDYTLWFIVPITLFVLALLVWCVVKFNARANPVPSKTSHHTLWCRSSSSCSWRCPRSACSTTSSRFPRAS